MKVTIEKDHTVSIVGDFTGPFIDLALSPADAYALLQRLEEKKSELYDLTTNYYECRDCAYFHLNTVKSCPNMEGE